MIKLSLQNKEFKIKEIYQAIKLFKIIGVGLLVLAILHVIATSVFFDDSDVTEKHRSISFVLSAFGVFIILIASGLKKVLHGRNTP